MKAAFYFIVLVFLPWVLIFWFFKRFEGGTKKALLHLVTMLALQGVFFLGAYFSNDQSSVMLWTITSTFFYTAHTFIFFVHGLLKYLDTID
ncbi:MAG: hypothetical protein ACK40M_11215 [Flavobacteriales bacterium]